MINNSIELAKLLGIKPVYSMMINIGDLDLHYITVTDKRKYRLIADNRHYFDDYDTCPEIIQECPDFMVAENFVKLLKVKSYTGATLLQEVTHSMFFHYTDLENSFVDSLIQLIESNGYSDQWRDSIKQNAQAVDWSYCND